MLINLPSKIRLEASSICQLNCVDCPNKSKLFEDNIGYGFLSKSSFEKVIKSSSWVKEVELSNFGEIFLNPEIEDIIKIAYDNNIVLTVNNGSNFNILSEQLAESIVKYKVKSITCSIDGSNNKTYKIYRKGGNFINAINNIKLVNYYKNLYNSLYPVLVWQFIIFGHNENEINEARELACELNMKFKIKLPWGKPFSPVKNVEYIRNLLGYSSRDEFKSKYGYNYKRHLCLQLWNRPQINWDGKLLGCCINFWGDYNVNVFNDGLKESLNSHTINYARGMLIGINPPIDSVPCSNCSIYKEMRQDKFWFDPKLIMDLSKDEYSVEHIHN